MTGVRHANPNSSEKSCICLWPVRTLSLNKTVALINYAQCFKIISSPYSNSPTFQKERLKEKGRKYSLIHSKARVTLIPKLKMIQKKNDKPVSYKYDL